MKFAIFVFLLCVFVFSSCQPNPEADYRKQIIGEWYPLDEDNMKGYEF